MESERACTGNEEQRLFRRFLLHDVVLLKNMFFFPRAPCQALHEKEN